MLLEGTMDLIIIIIIIKFLRLYSVILDEWMSMELVEWYWRGKKNKVFGENLS